MTQSKRSDGLLEFSVVLEELRGTIGRAYRRALGKPVTASDYGTLFAYKHESATGAVSEYLRADRGGDGNWSVQQYERALKDEELFNAECSARALAAPFTDAACISLYIVGPVGAPTNLGEEAMKEALVAFDDGKECGTSCHISRVSPLARVSPSRPSETDPSNELH